MISKKIRLFYILAGACALFGGLYFRLYPLWFYTNPDATEKATVLVISQLKTTVTQRVVKEYPHLPAYERNSIIKKNFDELLHKEGDMVRKTIDRVAKQMNAQRSAPYLLESDSFDYYNLTENIVKTGKMGDVKGSKYFNPLMLAPSGYYEPLNWHPYVGFLVYRVSQMMHPQISLMAAVAYTPLVVTALTVLVFFLLCAQLKCHPVTALTGAVFFFLAPIYIKRSCYGWYDNDPYNALFPLLILLFLFYGLASVQRRQMLIWGGVCALSTLVYALFWQGWVFFFSLLFSSGILMMLLNICYQRNTLELKRIALFFSVVLFGIFIAVALVFGFKDFFVLFKEGWKALQEFMNPRLSLWPDMYISVGELHQAAFSEIVDLTGGWLFFAGTLLGGVSFIGQGFRQKSKIILYQGIVVGLFFVLTFYLTLGAQRFALLCLIPMGILFTFGIQTMLNFLTTFVLQRLNPPAEKQSILKEVCPFVLLLLIVLPVTRADRTTLSLLNRIYNDTWDKSLTKIRQETPENSIVNTWWPPGHFIKATAHRRVTFDGATINKPQAYWMANILLNSDEKKALGLLRMLNGSGNDAVDYLLGLGKPLSQSVELLKDGTEKNKQEALALYSARLSAGQNEKLAELTHRPPVPAYIFVYNELVEKNLVLSFVDRWDFKKVEDINQNRALLDAVPQRKSKEYVQFLWKIAGGPLLYSDLLTLLTQKESFLVFDQGLQIDLKKMEARINSKKFGKGIPKKILYLNGDQLVEKQNPDANLPFTVVLFESDERYGAVLMDDRLAQSLLMRLYYFEGKGLKYFKRFDEESDLTRRTRILVYEVDWEKFEKDIGE